jgi:hypothetical protein
VPGTYSERREFLLRVAGLEDQYVVLEDEIQGPWLWSMNGKRVKQVGFEQFFSFFP